MKEQNAKDNWYFIRQLPVILYSKIDANLQIWKQKFIYTDGQQMKTSIYVASFVTVFNRAKMNMKQRYYLLIYWCIICIIITTIKIVICQKITQ